MDTLTMTGPVMSDDEFFEFCQRHEHLRSERTAEGEIIAKPLNGFETSDQSAGIIAQVYQWAQVDRRGRTCCHAGFILPNGAVRSSNAVWIPINASNRFPNVSSRNFPMF